MNTEEVHRVENEQHLDDSKSNREPEASYASPGNPAVKKVGVHVAVANPSIPLARRATGWGDHAASNHSMVLRSRRAAPATKSSILVLSLRPFKVRDSCIKDPDRARGYPQPSRPDHVSGKAAPRRAPAIGLRNGASSWPTSAKLGGESPIDGWDRR